MSAKAGFHSTVTADPRDPGEEFDQKASFEVQPQEQYPQHKDEQKHEPARQKGTPRKLACLNLGTDKRGKKISIKHSCLQTDSNASLGLSSHLLSDPQNLNWRI